MAQQDGFEAEADSSEGGRDPLPAGHPVAWAALVEGTLLHGLGWPGWGDVSHTAAAGGLV